MPLWQPDRVVNLAASNTTYTSGTVQISGGGNVTVGTNGQTITISAGSTPAFSGGVSTGGNTSGSTGTVSNQIVFAGGNNITLSQSTGAGGATVTISGPNVGGAQTGISGLANSETTYTSGSVTFSALGNLTIRSTTGQHFQFSVGAQTNQAGSVFAASNTTGTSSGTYDARTLSIAGDGPISVAASNSGFRISAPATSSLSATGIVSMSTNGSTISIGAPAVSMGFSTGGNTSGNSGTVSGQLVLAGGNNITLSGSTNGASQTITISAGTAAGGNFSGGVSNLGNTAGSTGITGTRLVLAGTNMVSLSQSTDANGGTISINATQSNQSGNAYAAGNSTGTSSGTFDARTLSIAGDGIISVAASNSGFRISATQSAQTQSNVQAVVPLGNTAGTTGSIQTGTIGLAGGANITISQSSGAASTNLTIIGPTQTNQSGNAYAIGNSTGTSSGTFDARTLSIAGDGIISVAASNSGFRISATQSVQTQDVLSIGASTAGNTSGNTTVNTGSRFVIAGGNNITVSQGTAAGATTLTISAFNQTAQSAIQALGVSNTGNTAGNTGVSTGINWVIAGSNNITASQSTAVGGPNTIWISGGAGGAGLSAGMSTGGNTSGNTGLVTGQLVLAGGNNITLSGSTNGGSMTLTVSAPNLGAGAMSAGMSNLGNTAGSSGITGTQLVLVGTGPVSLSQSTGAAGGTLSINAPATSSLSATGGLSISSNASTISIGQIPMSYYLHNSGVLHSSSSSAFVNSSVTVVHVSIPDNLSFSRVDIPMVVSLSSSAASHTAAHSISKVMILYTRNGSTLNAITGTSQTETQSWASNTANFNNLTGPRLLSFPLATSVTAGEYYVGYYLSSNTFSTGANTTNLGGTYGVLFQTGPQTATMWAQLGSATAQTSSPISFMAGAQSISLSATNQTIQASNVTQSGTAFARAGQALIFRNV